MKVGDLVVPITKDVYLVSDNLENAIDVTATYYGVRTDLIVFKPDTMAIVLEINPNNTARAKVFYDNAAWWVNVSEVRRVK